MKFVHLITIITLCISLKIFSSHAIEPGQIILLNGTSSAGKSSIAQELKKVYGSPLKIIAIDDYTREIFGAKFDKKMWEDFYVHNKNLSKLGYSIAIDTLDFENDYEKYCAILGTNVIKVLVYCPIDTLAEHIEQRNQSRNSRDHRNNYQAYYQFLNVYGSKKPEISTLVDCIDSSDMHDRLQKITENIAITSSRIIKNNPTAAQDIMQKFIQQFNLHEPHEILLVQQHPWDLVINTSIDSPATAAQKIINFINLQDKN